MAEVDGPAANKWEPANVAVRPGGTVTFKITGVPMMWFRVARLRLYFDSLGLASNFQMMSSGSPCER